MQISMVMSGFSAGKADKLRKAMGKKKLDVMMKLKDDWCNGAVENGYSLEIAEKIWEDAEKFAKYAVNKSHSARKKTQVRKCEKQVLILLLKQKN